MFNLHSSSRSLILLLAIAMALAGCTTTTKTSNEPQPTITSTPVETEAASKINAEIDAYLRDLANNDLFIGSVLIAREGQILFSDGFGFANRDQNIVNTPQVSFRLASIGKQFTAVAILLLQEQGKLDVQDLICEYLSDCLPEWEAISIHHLLTHSSGISDWGTANIRSTEIVNHFTGKNLNFQPGDRFSYSNSGYNVLGLIIEQVSSQTYGDFLQENIFTPLNLASTSFDVPLNETAVGYSSEYIEASIIETSVLFAAGGISSTTEDLYRLWEALFAEQLISQDNLSEMFAGHFHIPSNEWKPSSGEWAYGYGWYIGEENNRRIFLHGGTLPGFKTIIVHYPDEQVTIVLLSNRQNTQREIIHDELSKIIFEDE